MTSYMRESETFDREMALYGLRRDLTEAIRLSDMKRPINGPYFWWQRANHLAFQVATLSGFWKDEPYSPLALGKSPVAET